MDPKYYKLLKRFTVAFLLPWLLSGQSEAQTAPIKVPCGNTGIMVELPTSWEAVATQHPFVRCAFRNPSSGFPTFNILEEPKPAGFDPSKERQESELLRSYRLAGLTDAAVISSENITIDERPAYQAVVRYTSAGKAMTAVVTIIGFADRLYTGTLLDLTEAFRLSEKQLLTIGQSIHLPRAPVATSPAAEKRPFPETASGSMTGRILGALIVLSLLVVASLKWRKRARGQRR